MTTPADRIRAELDRDYHRMSMQTSGSAKACQAAVLAVLDLCDQIHGGRTDAATEAMLLPAMARRFEQAIATAMGIKEDDRG